MVRAGKVLLVDDESVIRELVRRVLDEELIEASCVAEAEAAWKESGPFDVAIVDKNLPDGSGLDLVARLKQSQPDAEVILITGYPSFDSAVAALRCGAFDYMTKPFVDIDQLRLKVQKAIEHRLLRLSRGVLSRELDDAVAGRMEAERERRHMETELRRSQKMQALGRLAGGIAHDFNNLLVPILNYGDFMLRALDRLDDETESQEQKRLIGSLREYCEDVAAAGHSAAELSRQLLSFSRDEVVAPQVLSVNEIAHTVQRLVRRSGMEHIEIDARLEEQLWPVEAERSQLEQLLMNLCVNACDAMHAGGTLTIRTENAAISAEGAAALGLGPGRYVRLAIADTGPGIPEAILQHIYEPFFTTKEASRGTGLGLATAYRIAEQHGGKLHVWSEVERGTTFHIYLPVSDRQLSPRARRSSTGPPARPSGDGEMILVVEDDERVRRLVRKVLDHAGYRVREAAQGEEGWALFREEPEAFDLILTDILMPKLRGGELARRIRSVRDDVEIVYMSAYALDTIVRRELAGEEITLIPKPFDDEELLRVVRRALDRR